MPLRHSLHEPGSRLRGTPCLLTAVLIIGLGLAACTTTPSTSPKAAPVLGEGTGSPDVEGQPAPDGTGQLGAVSCADANRCWAVGVGAPSTGGAGTPSTVIVATGDGGLTWKAEVLTDAVAPDLTGVACPRPTACMAVGSVGANPPIGAVLTTNDGGRSWHNVSIPVGALAVIGVTCADAANCTILVSDGTILWSATTDDFGHTWARRGNLPTGLQDARDISCTAAGTCLVAGNTPTSTGHGQGSVVVSADGGATWTAANVPAGTGLLQDAGCASATRCLAVGTTSGTVSDVVPARGALLVSDDGGHTWTPSVVAQPIDNIFGVQCPSARVCVMVGTHWLNHTSVGKGAVATSMNGGATFRAASTEYTPLSLTAADCPDSVHCIAVGGNTVARIQLPVIKTPARHRRSFR